jgi:hypothetical protein
LVKKCRLCGREKSISKFKSSRTYKNKTYYHSYCTLCKSKYDRFRSYKLTDKELRQIKKKQDYKCAICKTLLKKKFNVDHCHETNVVRGLLCYSCNTALGKFKDDVDIIYSAFNYIIKNQNKHYLNLLYSYKNGNEYQKDN